MEFDELEEYKKDVKKLKKKYRSIIGDIEIAKQVLKIRPNARPHFSFQINGLGIKTCIVKVKKIASDSFKGKGNNSGFRLVYAYFKDTQKIVLVELYHKSNKENEDRNRISRNFG